MTIDSNTKTQPYFEEINSIEKLESFINNFCQSEGSYHKYIPSLTQLSDNLYISLTKIKAIAESSNTLQDLSAKINSCIEYLSTYQEQTPSETEKNKVIKTVSQTLSNFKKELKAAFSDIDIDDEFEMLNSDSESEEEHNLDDQYLNSMVYSLYDSTWDASRTLSLRLYNYLIGQSLEDVIKIPEKIPEEYSYTIKSLIENLGGRLTTREVIDFLNALTLSKVYQHKAEILGVGLCNKHTIEGRKPSVLFERHLNLSYVKAAIEKTGAPPTDLIFIPFIFKGSYLLDMLPYVDTGHVVLITVCFSTQTIEYYDSLANSPDSWTCYENFCMKEELEKIKMQYFGSAQGKVLISRVKQQHDWHSCGVFIIWYIIQRLNGVLHKEITSKTVTAADIEYIRTELGRLLASPKKLNKRITINTLR